MMSSDSVMSPAPSTTKDAFHRQKRSTTWPIGIFRIHGSPAQNPSPATKAAERSRYSFRKKAPATEVSPDTPAAK